MINPSVGGAGIFSFSVGAKRSGQSFYNTWYWLNFLLNLVVLVNMVSRQELASVSVGEDRFGEVCLQQCEKQAHIHPYHIALTVHKQPHSIHKGRETVNRMCENWSIFRSEISDGNEPVMIHTQHLLS